MADQLGVDANHAWTAFGPTNVRTHALARAIALGDVDRAMAQRPSPNDPP